MLKVVIAGCGKIADAHVAEIQKMRSRARLVAVCDRERLMAEQLAVRFGVPHHDDDLARLLKRERPDVLHITTPPQSHLALARVGLEAGCHLYVEKPFAMTRAESAEMLRLAESAHRKVTVGYSIAFDPPALALRQLVAEGVLGDPVHVDSFYGYDLSGPFGRALLSDRGHWVHRLPGKLFQNVADHLLNKITEFVTDEEPQVSAFGYTRRAERFGDERDQLMDELRIIVQGARVSGTGIVSAHIRPVGHFLKLYGTRNTAHVDFVARTVTLDVAPPFPSALGRLAPAFGQAVAYLREGSRNVLRFLRSDFHYFAGMNHLMTRFYDSIEKDTPVPVAYRDILRVSGLMDQVFQQIAPTRRKEVAA